MWVVRKWQRKLYYQCILLSIRYDNTKKIRWKKYSMTCFQVSNKNIVEWHPSIIFLVISVKTLGISETYGTLFTNGS